MKSIKEQIKEAAHANRDKSDIVNEDLNSFTSFNRGADYGYRLCLQLMKNVKVKDHYSFTPMFTQEQIHWIENKLEGGDQ